MSRAGSAFAALMALVLLIAGLLLVAGWLGPRGLVVDFQARNLAPGFAHPFGTDAMGRDLLARSLHGLSLSLQVGLLASGLSLGIATLVAGLSASGPRADAVAVFGTDVMLALPHLLLLLLLAFAMGGGSGAVVLAVAISHWPRLARILRAEVLQLSQAPFVETARALGRSPLAVFWHHLLPHLAPQMLVGFLLMFPHAILHEAALSFLGFGLEPSRPSIGVMLADAMRHISAGRWWLAVFPGAMLLALVLAFEVLGSRLRRLITGQEVAC